MHDRADAVAAEVGVDLVAGLAQHRADRMRDVASAAARPESSSDRSPRTSASTTSASSRASQAPRVSAKLA